MVNESQAIQDTPSNNGSLKKLFTFAGTAANVIAGAGKFLLPNSDKASEKPMVLDLETSEVRPQTLTEYLKDGGATLFEQAVDILPFKGAVTDLNNGNTASEVDKATEDASGLAGAALAGAVAGSFIPGVGTCAGIAIGMTGECIGGYIGDKVGDRLSQNFTNQANPPAPIRVPAQRAELNLYYS